MLREVDVIVIIVMMYLNCSVQNTYVVCCRHENAMQVYKETKEYNDQKPEPEPSPEYPKEVLLAFVIHTPMYELYHRIINYIYKLRISSLSFYCVQLIIILMLEVVIYLIYVGSIKHRKSIIEK